MMNKSYCFGHKISYPKLTLWMQECSCWILFKIPVFLQDNEINNKGTEISNASLGDDGGGDGTIEGNQGEEEERDCFSAWGDDGEHTVEMCEFWMEGVLVTVTGERGPRGKRSLYLT